MPAPGPTTPDMPIQKCCWDENAGVLRYPGAWFDGQSGQVIRRFLFDVGPYAGSVGVYVRVGGMVVSATVCTTLTENPCPCRENAPAQTCKKSTDCPKDHTCIEGKCCDQTDPLGCIDALTAGGMPRNRAQQLVSRQMPMRATSARAVPSAMVDVYTFPSGTSSSDGCAICKCAGGTCTYDPFTGAVKCHGYKPGHLTLCAGQIRGRPSQTGATPARMVNELSGCISALTWKPKGESPTPEDFWNACRRCGGRPDVENGKPVCRERQAAPVVKPLRAAPSATEIKSFKVQRLNGRR